MKTKVRESSDGKIVWKFNTQCQKTGGGKAPVCPPKWDPDQDFENFENEDDSFIVRAKSPDSQVSIL